MVAVGTDIYVHGGMEGTTIHSDMYKFDTGAVEWCRNKHFELSTSYSTKNSSKLSVSIISLEKKKLFNV